MACECGAYKVYKAIQNAREHSDWCPWSPNYFEWLCRKKAAIQCMVVKDDYTKCLNPAERWITQGTYGGGPQFPISQDEDPRFYFCSDCWTTHVNTFGMGGIVDWGWA